MTADAAPDVGNWDGGWRAHREAQLEAWCRATSAQRLAWLEAAMGFARDAILADRRETITKW